MSRAVVAAVVIAVLTTMATVVAGGAAASGQGMEAAPPPTIPAVRQWTGGGVPFTVTPDTRVTALDAALAPAARMLADDLTATLGRPVQVADAASRPGDVELRLGQADGGPEGYRITVGATVVVTAGAAGGVFHGTRTVLQWLRQTRNLPGGTVVDWPTYPERGLMVDLGRKHMSLDWLRARVREMSYLKLNHLHLHLSDVHGFRLASATHPEIVAERHYTVAEMRDLIAYAAARNVRIVPELDFPGHLDSVLAAHPELRLVSASGTVEPGKLDLANPASYDLVRDLITEFLPLFPGEYWHLGADEYVTDYAAYPQLLRYAREHYGPDATAKDTYHGFVNWANDIVRASGKTMRVWNDGLQPGGATITVSPDIVVEHWSRSGPPPWFGPAYPAADLVAAGHRVQNASFTPTYYTTGGWAALFNTSPAWMYDTWDPGLFVDGTRLPDVQRSRHLGSKLHVWCDAPDALSEAQLAAVVHDRLRVTAQHTWGTPRPALYLLFLPAIWSVGDPPA